MKCGSFNGEPRDGDRSIVADAHDSIHVSTRSVFFQHGDKGGLIDKGSLINGLASYWNVHLHRVTRAVPREFTQKTKNDTIEGNPDK